MIGSVARALWRQRRIALTMLAFVLILVSGEAGDGQIRDILAAQPWWISAIAFGIMAVLILLVTAMLCAALPILRLVPLMLLLAEPLGRTIHAMAPTDSFVAGMAPLLSIVAVCTLLYSPRLIVWLPTVRTTRRAHLTTRAMPPAILNATIPGLGPVGSYWGALHDAQVDPDRPDRRRVRYSRGLGGFEVQDVTILERGPHGGRYHFVNDVSAEVAKITEGTYGVAIGAASRRGRRRVELTLERRAQPLINAIVEWLLDTMGREADAVAAKLARGCDASGVRRDVRLIRRLS